MSDRSIPGPVHIVIGAAMVLMSAFIDPMKLSIFILVGAGFIVYGFIRILSKEKKATHAHYAAKAQGVHHAGVHNPTHHTATHPAAQHSAHQLRESAHQTQHNSHHTTTMRCSSCGVKLHPMFKYCPSCGQKMA